MSERFFIIDNINSYVLEKYNNVYKIDVIEPFMFDHIQFLEITLNNNIMLIFYLNDRCILTIEVYDIYNINVCIDKRFCSNEKDYKNMIKDVISYNTSEDFNKFINNKRAINKFKL